MRHLFYLFIFLFLFTSLSFSQDYWINEFSYNSLDDGDEFIELVAPVGTDMSRFKVAFFKDESGGFDDYFTYYATELTGIISSTNSNASKGFFVIKTNNSHLLELNTPVPVGITKQTVDTHLDNTPGSGFLLLDSETSKIVHCIIYELPIDATIPSTISNQKLEDNPLGIEAFDLTRVTLDGIREPLVDGGESDPDGSISMIGSGFSRLWTTTTGDAPNNSTPGALNYSQGALPVELSSFSATVLSNGVKLNWRTETETNNFGFDIERKNNGGDWVTLSFVNGNGNSNSPKEYNYIDNSAKVGKYSYRLKQIDNDGQYSYSKVVDVDLTKTLDYNLTQNFPNPFNPTTSISFSLPKSGVVKLTVYNLLGQEIKTLVNGFKESGVHHVNFNAKDLNSGIYIYKIETTDYTQTRKMTLVK